jgi:AcrR family transcriptional regulator
VTGKRGRPSRRREIVLAAAAVLRERGLNGMTTRAVAAAVPCSEGAIYVHFEDRLALVIAVLEESLPEMLVPLHQLLGKVGSGDPERNLIAAVHGLGRFHARVVPMLCSLVSEPELLERFRQSLAGSGRGPHRGVATLAQYFEEEQKRGRIDRGVNAKAAAGVLMASAFFHQFRVALLGSAERLDARGVVRLALQRSGGKRLQKTARST